jgi:hypothetical protein
MRPRRERNRNFQDTLPEGLERESTFGVSVDGALRALRKAS